MTGFRRPHPARETKVSRADPNDLGPRAQDEFEAAWKDLGKHGYLYRFRDTRDLWRLNNGATKQYELPSDYLCSQRGVTALVEVKGTADAQGFSTSSLRRSQKQHATLLTVAGGRYLIAIRAYALCVNAWFLVPADALLDRKGRISWSDLTAYKTKEPVFVP